MTLIIDKIFNDMERRAAFVRQLSYCFAHAYVSVRFMYIRYRCIILAQLDYPVITAETHKKLSCRRDRATLRVIEYFAKSLKVNRNDTVG